MRRQGWLLLESLAEADGVLGYVPRGGRTVPQRRMCWQLKMGNSGASGSKAEEEIDSTGPKGGAATAFPGPVEEPCFARAKDGLKKMAGPPFAVRVIIARTGFSSAICAGGCEDGLLRSGRCGSGVGLCCRISSGFGFPAWLPLFRPIFRLAPSIRAERFFACL